MKKLKAFAVVFVVLCGLLLPLSLTMAEGATTARPVIKIGALGPLALTPGKDMLQAAQLAVDEINANGGVTVGSTAYDFQLISETTSGATGLPEAATATSNLAKLQDEDNVTALIGGFRTEVTVAVQASLSRPMLGVGSTAPIITPYFWRVTPTNGTQLTRAIIELYYAGLFPLGVKKVTIIREDANWALAMRNGLVTYLHTVLPCHLNFTEDVAIAEGATYDAVLSALTPVKSWDSDALMTVFSGPAGKQITLAWASLNMTQMMAGINVECQASTYFVDTEGAAYGEIELEIAPPDVSPTSKTGAFRTAYKAKTSEEPTYTAFGSYDSIYVLKDAIERADSLEATPLQAALKDTNYEGASYQIQFTSEPGSQLGVDSSGNKVPIPGAPTNITVHDMYTKTTVGVRNAPHPVSYFAQWQKGGVKKTIWGAATTMSGENITAVIQYPINHAEHGYVPTKAPQGTPGFELPLVLFVLGNLIILVRMRKRKKW